MGKIYLSQLALSLGTKYAHVFRAGGKRWLAKMHSYPFELSGGKCVQETRILIPEAAWKHLNPYGTAVDISIGGCGHYDGFLVTMGPCHELNFG
jgi:hypothetical protein